MALTDTESPVASALDSLPVNPSNGCFVRGETLPESEYRKPSMWSNDRFSNTRTTT